MDLESTDKSQLFKKQVMPDLTAFDASEDDYTDPEQAQVEDNEEEKEEVKIEKPLR